MSFCGSQNPNLPAFFVVCLLTMASWITPAPSFGSHNVPSATFNQPSINGYRLDWCREWGTDCGQGAANAFCHYKGYTNAGYWRIDPNIGAHSPTQVIDTGQICNQSFCDSFEVIRCQQASYLELVDFTDELQDRAKPPPPPPPCQGDICSIQQPITSCDYCRDAAERCLVQYCDPATSVPANLTLVGQGTADCEEAAVLCAGRVSIESCTLGYEKTYCGAVRCYAGGTGTPLTSLPPLFDSCQ